MAKFTACSPGHFWPLTLLVNSIMHRQRIFDGINAHYNLLLSPRLGLIWSKRGCCYYAHALNAFICQKVNFIQRLNTEYRDGGKCLIKSFPGNTSRTHKRASKSQESKLVLLSL
jgi:hypothetical protein